MTEPYDPLDTYNLARSIQQQILAQERKPLSEMRHTAGAGVYAIYYGGEMRMYGKLAASLGSDEEIPIYVGKAIPKGGRVGGLTRDSASGRRLGEWLGVHSDSISETKLGLSNFSARALVISDVWIPLGENMLITQFRPVWNLVASGFGNKAPGIGRPGQKLSLWDTLHPGRGHSSSLKPNLISPPEIAARVEAFLAGKSDVPITPEVEAEGD